MSYLVLKDLDKQFPGTKGKVLDKMNLTIEKGEFIVFLGPSGCGKTTTIRLISGLEELTGGEILIEGEPIMHLPPKDRGVSMIFQSYAIWPHMTVFNNIAYPLKLRKMPKPEIKKKVHQAASITNITEYLDRYPHQLSGGQRQRVAVSRAIVVEPKIFLMDEPLSNLDAKLRVSMRTDLKNIHMQLGATSIFVTHDQSEAMSLADRIVVMKDGLIEQIGAPNQVYHDCETAFVASFIGTPPTNFFTGSVRAQGEDTVISSDVFSYIVPDNMKASLGAYIGKEVLLGIRPEFFVLDEGRRKDLFCRTTVDFIEPQGSHCVVICHVGDTVVKVIMAADMSLGHGAPISLYVRENRAMLFDPVTQKRIR